MDPKDASTIDQLVNAGKNVILTYNNLAILEKIQDMYLPVDNIIYTYIDELKKYIVPIRLTEMELVRYKYKPKLLAFDVYGSTDLYFVIMALNGIIDVRDFNMSIVNMFKKEHMNTLMSYVYNAEKIYLDYNRDEVGL
ncbi:MAG: baseplate wedge protein 53 [Bacilli bacterium]|nr:baseplate wedge protein 53 [Bacilli bacterium]